MKREKKYLYMVAALLCIIGTYSCKQEFFPPEVGAPIPIDQDNTVYPALLEALPETGYETFKAIWNRSEVKDLIATGEYGKETFTYFVPQDDVLAAAGYTPVTIQGMSRARLDTLVRMHVMRSKIVIAGLPVGTDLSLNSLLQIQEFPVSSEENYIFRHYLHKDAEGLIHNGDPMGIVNELPVNNGSAVLVDRLLNLPDKQMIDIIKGDDRFSLFLEAMDLNIAMRVNFHIVNWYTDGSFMHRALYEYPYIFDASTVPESYRPDFVSSTLFLPTNEAFHQVGIHTVEDVIALSQRTDIGDIWGNQKTPLENVLHLHTLKGDAVIFTNNDYNRPDYPVYVEVSNAPNPSSNPIFFAHDFLNPQFSQSRALIPYSFNIRANDNKVTVQAVGSAYEPATISETIMTWQGPVHIVNRLIIEEGVEL
ncbi:fasciclin domain-containing protein [Sphingobacterium haloxyli]|uniref:FAS1 domain-containing protein n=1 Tax=Sphingobacterium haloxyli TaxID=2100533 RepID=A0A2S9J4U5_9SPHI|nr:fasciclin domain-containing protein [Sphingobacterium haloxyli]PRD47813.1 hypothetical protein C5745_07815 [Sphingobacterium haloxyli]